MQNATVNLKTLASVSLFASTEQTRYYLNGVYVEITPDHITYIATDGSAMFVTRDVLKVSEPRNTLVGNWIIHTEQCKAFKFSKRSEHDTYGVLSKANEDDAMLNLARNGTAISFKPIDGTYPDWRRIIPTLADEDKVAQFNPKLLLSFTKASDMMNLGQPVVTHNGAGPALVTYRDTFSFGVVMPRKALQEGRRAAPAWVTPVDLNKVELAA